MAATDKKLVLCVEDEPDIGWLIEHSLETLPVETVLKANGFDALEVLEERQPDLVILDLMLPQMSGWQFLERVRADERWQDMPVMVLTVLSGQEDVKRGKELKVARYMTKPFVARQLQAAVRALLNLEETD